MPVVGLEKQVQNASSKGLVFSLRGAGVDIPPTGRQEDHEISSVEQVRTGQRGRT